MWIWPLLNSQIPTGGHESAAQEPTRCYWAAVPQLSIVTLTAHNLASALPLLTSAWKNLEIGISAFLKVSRSHPVSQFCMYDFMRLWVFLVCSALLVAARQGSLWQHRRSADSISSIHWINPFVMWKCHWHFIIVWFWSNNMCTHCMCTCDVWQIAYCIPCQSRVHLSLPSSVNEAFEGLDRSAFVQSFYEWF